MVKGKGQHEGIPGVDRRPLEMGIRESPWGVKVTRIEIKDIEPPRGIVDSMARQMKAERDKRAAILEAEGKRQASILAAEGEKQAAGREGGGRGKAGIGGGGAREREAEGEGEATQVVSEAIAAGDVQAINYFVAGKYIEALKDIATSPNQKLVLMPLEAASVIGALGGIGAIAKEALGGGWPGGAPPRPALIPLCRRRRSTPRTVRGGTCA